MYVHFTRLLNGEPLLEVVDLYGCQPGSELNRKGIGTLIVNTCILFLKELFLHDANTQISGYVPPLNDYDFQHTSTANYRINFWERFGFNFKVNKNGHRMSAYLNSIHTSNRSACFTDVPNLLLPSSFTFIEFENKENVIQIMQKNTARFIDDSMERKFNMIRQEQQYFRFNSVKETIEKKFSNIKVEMLAGINDKPYMKIYSTKKKAVAHGLVGLIILNDETNYNYVNFCFGKQSGSDLYKIGKCLLIELITQINDLRSSYCTYGLLMVNEFGCNLNFTNKYTSTWFLLADHTDLKTNYYFLISVALLQHLVNFCKKIKNYFF